MADRELIQIRFLILSIIAFAFSHFGFGFEVSHPKIGAQDSS